jgi:hypothetical protein
VLVVWAAAAPADRSADPATMHPQTAVRTNRTGRDLTRIGRSRGESRDPSP